MSNTVITNYTDLNGPSTKADSSVVVIVNKDGSLSVDENLLGTLMGTDGSQGAGISVVRVGHEGRPDDATDSESDDDKIPHVTLSVDSYYDEPNSIIKYDSGAEMLQSLIIETRENSLLGFQNDHCYTPLRSPNQGSEQSNEGYAVYDEPIIEIKQQSPPKIIPSSKKITILEQKIIPKGRKILINPSEATIIKGSDALTKPLVAKAKPSVTSEKTTVKTDESVESSSISSSGDSIPDRDSDSDYKDGKDKATSIKKQKAKPRILKSAQAAKLNKIDPKVALKLKNKNILKKEIKAKILNKTQNTEQEHKEIEKIKEPESAPIEKKDTPKTTPKVVKKEKKTSAALLSDMSSLFSTPDVIRRVSTDNKTAVAVVNKDPIPGSKQIPEEINKAIAIDTKEKPKTVTPKLISKQKPLYSDKPAKGYDLIPQLDDASLAQILQDTNIPGPAKVQPTLVAPNAMNSPSLAGPLSPTLDLLGGLQPEEEGLTEDLLMHVAQLVESSENLQEVIDKQVLGKVDTVANKPATTATPTTLIHQQSQNTPLYAQTPIKTNKPVVPRKDPIEVVRKDGRVITLPPIEAPATRASKRKSQMEAASSSVVLATPPPVAVQHQVAPTPQEPIIQQPTIPKQQPITPKQQPTISKQYINKKLANKKPEVMQPVVEKTSAESQESWNSEDDPNGLWCICRQPHSNRFMICCDGCEDWFHGKCVNITKAMGQQMEEQGIEWRCPNCVKKAKNQKPNLPRQIIPDKKRDSVEGANTTPPRPPGESKGSSKTGCIVCKKAARASSIYCSDACILKHAQDSLGTQDAQSKADGEPGKAGDKMKSESRVIVFERKTGRCLAGPNAPTAENLKAWLQKNPTFEVVRPGTLSTPKPRLPLKKSSGNESNKIQTTLNFERIPKKVPAQSTLLKSPQGQNEQMTKVSTPVREENRSIQPKTPSTPKTQPPNQFYDTPKSSTIAKPGPSTSEVKKPVRTAISRAQDKPSVSPSTSRRKDSHTPKMDSADTIRENVRKSLQEQIIQRMKEASGAKLTQKEIQDFANETEEELHELFKDVGVKYKAKYRSLMFNIKDRKNHSLWEKICEKVITPNQLVRLSPEELASQELAQWRDQEAKHQLELIKKSELDLLAANKTYVLKTHKGEEVMETKESVSTELDPNVPVEDVVTALNEGEEAIAEAPKESNEAIRKMSSDSSEKNSKKKETDERTKKSKESKRDSESRKSRSSRKRSDAKQTEERPRRSERRSSRIRSPSKEKSKVESKKETRDRSKHRSRSRGKSKRRSRSREHSRSNSQGRDRSRSRGRSKRRSRSREMRRRNSSRNKTNLKSKSDDKMAHRSRSQDNTSSKSKNDSTDSDSVERPKSAMMKESHPEYDPHEPMITSAFSEEDLRKSREDVFEDSYKADIVSYENSDYDPDKAFTINTNIVLPKYNTRKQDKASEVESDQEPSSTVDNAAATVWSGCINMVDVARFYVAAHEVSGSSADLEEDLRPELDIVGRIKPDTVWDYINKMKRAGNKDIVIMRLQAANDEERMQYIALYSYLSSRNRLGVVEVTNTTTVKDFYILPLPANATLPEVLLPFDGPGLEEAKTHLLIAIVIRQKRKRAGTHIPKDIVPAKVPRVSRKRSYTPPPAPSVAPAPYTSPALSTTVKDKIAASLAAPDDEAYSPGSSSNDSSTMGRGGSSADTLRCKMEELNRQIEEQKQQIRKMVQADSSVAEENEAYSPSRPMTPPPVVPLADIALPSNLQEILATIKQQSTATDVDMRTKPLS